MQNLTDKFRYDYSQFWLAIIRRDRTAMRRHAEQLGITGELYGLFACMVTGRPWATIMHGIDRSKPDQAEVITILARTNQREFGVKRWTP